ncbi:MAG: DegT/DnrJ/EryC1/StrS aminotransferase family protein [Deltaproteobacteria bacterium]|nr:DegT/DnrJ/EryC1/StrS aminotransferase family protein [Deltaproteobacteria bacterium]
MHPQDTKRYILSIYNPPRAKTPWRLEELEKGLKTRYFSFGRLALAEALKLCGVGPGDRVLLPSFICRDVLAPIHAVKASPLYYPVGRDLQTDFDPGRIPSAKAALFVNYFGFPQEPDVFERYRDRVGAFLIEDNAHGLFGRDEEGRLLGTREDMGVFSLRKSIPLPNGAVLVINHPDLKDNLPEQEPFEFSYSDIFFRRKQNVRRIIGSLGIWSVRLLTSMLRARRWIMTGSPAYVSAPAGETVLPSPVKCTPMLKGSIETVQPEQETERRRTLYRILDQWIKNRDKCTPIFKHLPDGVVPYGYPFFCKEGDFKEVEHSLFKNGFPCISWPDLPHELGERPPSFYREVRLVPFLW